MGKGTRQNVTRPPSEALLVAADKKDYSPRFGKERSKVFPPRATPIFRARTPWYLGVASNMAAGVFWKLKRVPKLEGGEKQATVKLMILEKGQGLKEAPQKIFNRGTKKGR